VQGWITLTNSSGTPYTNANVLLVAGAVGVMGQPQPYPARRGAAAPLRQAGTETADRERLGDFYLYPLPERTTIANQQTKQVSFLDVHNSPASRAYEYRNAWMHTTDQPESANSVLRFSSAREQGLGDALPAGTVRVYQRDARGNPHFVGESPIGHVAVTVYRDPTRGPGDAFNLSWLNGYALISETRQITLEPGESEIRFEGVAGGIIPQSAIVTGLPEGLIERNRDAYLLSPATLLDRSLGRRVTLRRTSRTTGAVRETEAIIRSSANGAVVLQTADGFESLRCTGLNETLIYDSVPQGLSARPTLSVRARSSGSVTATVPLPYLASGFDWQANYI